MQLVEDGHEEDLDRPLGADVPGPGRDTAGPALPGQGRRGADRFVEGPPCVLPVSQHVPQAGLQPTPAPAPALRTPDPAAHFRRFGPRKGGGEGAVGGVEEMVPLVEHDATQAGGFHIAPLAAGGAGAVEGGMAEHERVVGDHEVGRPGGAHRLFDEAGAIVLARGVDALAASVDEIERPGARGRRHGEQGRQPRGEIAAGHVAVARRADPAGDQPQSDQVLRAQLSGVHRILEIEQADIVLASLAHHGLAGAHGGIGEDRPAFPVDLPLQGAGVGRYPHPRPVGPGPQGGRGQIAQGLADPGAGLGQHHHRLAVPHPGLEGEGGLRRVFHLARAGFVEARALQQLGQPGRRLFRIDRPRPWLAWGRLVFPFHEAAPDVQAGPAPRTLGLQDAQRTDDRRGPGPAGAAQGLPLCEGFLAAGRRRGGQLRQQARGRFAQRRGLFDRTGRLGQARRQRQADRGGRAEPGRANEGEELQDIQQARRARRRGQFEPAGRHRRMGDEHRTGFEDIPRLGRAQGPGPKAIGDRAASARRHDKGRRQIQQGGGWGHAPW